MRAIIADLVRSLSNEGLARMLCDATIDGGRSVLRVFGDEELLRRYDEEIRDNYQDIVKEKLDHLNKVVDADNVEAET